MDRPRDEVELVLASKRGDTAAFETIIRNYQRLAFRAAYVITGDASDAEEAMQDAFVKAWRALRRFDTRRPFRPWLLSIVGNEARNRRRSAGRRDALVLRLVEQPSGGAVPSPEVDSIQSDRRRALLQAVNTLPEDQRGVVVARYFLELAEKETAEMLGIPAGTVKSRLTRALDSLRAQFGVSCG